MQVLRVCLAAACLLLCGFPALAAETKPPAADIRPPAARVVVRVPPEQAMPILGLPVTGPDGKTIGRLVDVLVDATGVPEAAVIDVGGFMGVGTRKIAVHWSTLHFAPTNHKQPITLDLTLDQIKAAPEYGSPSKPAPVVLPVHARPPIPPAATPAMSTGAGAKSTAPPAGSPSATPTPPSKPAATSSNGAPAGNPSTGTASAAPAGATAATEAASQPGSPSGTTPSRAIQPVRPPTPKNTTPDNAAMPPHSQPAGAATPQARTPASAANSSSGEPAGAATPQTSPPSSTVKPQPNTAANAAVPPTTPPAGAAAPQHSPTTQ